VRKRCLPPLPDGTVRGMERESYAEALGMTEGAVRVAIHRLRQRYREALRNEVAQTLDDGESVETEIRNLLGAV